MITMHDLTIGLRLKSNTTKYILECTLAKYVNSKILTKIHEPGGKHLYLATKFSTFLITL